MIKSIELINWKSHFNSFFKFSSGTNVLIGKMGAGKSSVVDGICFALFGTFPALNARKLSIDELITSKPNKKEKSVIKLSLEFNNQTYLIERIIFSGRKSSQARVLVNGVLKAGPKPKMVNEFIESLLGIDFNLFSRAIYSEQNDIDFFLKLNSRDRKKKFDELFELNSFELVRQNSVTLINKLKSMVFEKKKALNDLEKEFDFSKINSLESSLKQKSSELIFSKDSFNASEKQLDFLTNKLKKLNEKKLKFNHLKEKQLSIESVLIDLRKRIKELSFSLDVDELIVSGAEKQKKLNQLKESLIKALSEKSSLLSKSNSLKETLNDLSDKIKKKNLILNEINSIKEKFGDLSKLIVSTKNFIKENQSKLSKLNAKSIELNDALSKLSSSKGECLVCGSLLSEQKKQELISSKKNELFQLNDTIFSLNKTLTEKEKTLNNLIELNYKFGIAKEKIADKKDLESKFNLISNELNSIDFNSFDIVINDLKSSIGSLEKDLENYRKAKEVIVLRKNEKSLCSELSAVVNNLNALDFNDSQLNDLNNLISTEKEKIVFFKGKISSLTELISHEKNLLELIKKNFLKVNNLKNEINSFNLFIELISVFFNAVISSQEQLRQYLIEAINASLSEIFSELYPYDDFKCARINVFSGDYVLEVQNSLNEWQRVDGLLSGGERSCAAIALRIAFSLVLTKKLSWLILDEPTHNLDFAAVEKIALLFKEKLPELVEQIFIITHDINLKNAASGSFYSFDRNKDLNEPTKLVNFT